RKDLGASLAKRQSTDGSWSNSDRRWFEDDKNLATSFALLALANCKAKNATKPTVGTSAAATPATSTKKEKK
ncbi:MAG TPA: hypothetical protein VM260_09915, partial [Pirellula sp.]|nr:hypothetical protein [Pirellula sp.]